MGVPKFYRWLSERYPSVNQVISDLTLVPEFDNLYIDMNGIIHACTHDNDQKEIERAPTQQEIIENVWEYVDRIVTQIVKPQKLLYIAVDGVAPRAKMNHQRARRFRASKDLGEAIAEAKREGMELDDVDVFNSNVITPGTDFMQMIDEHLRYFIAKRMKEDALWRRLTVVYSGQSVPGEGEHKIMQYIRDLKASPDYRPNVRHCLYGQDADLIMLGLATHEPHFTLLREVVDFGRYRRARKEKVQKELGEVKDASFQLLHLSLLREYLELEFLRDVPEESRDVERVVDDFMCLTFLVGNDFIPHLPSLDISEHAFDRLFEIYSQHFRQPGGNQYLVEGGKINADKLQAFFNDIGSMEDQIFEKREEDLAAFAAKRKKGFMRINGSSPVPSGEDLKIKEAEAQSQYEAALQTAVKEGKLPAEKALGTRADGKKDFKGRYYFEKFGVLDASESPVVSNVCRSYAEGLAWCLAYYIKGCVSWKWFYPFHYGPLISDVKDLRDTLGSLQFELGEPFTPFEQQLSCLPAESARCLPPLYQPLMTSPASPIRDFFPKDFEVDLNGKVNAWEGVVLIPFIDEERMRRAVRAFCPDSALTPSERRRNQFGPTLQFEHDPSASTTVPSCDPGQFPDYNMCQIRITNIDPVFESSSTFEPRLVPGTKLPSPGFPSLKVLPIANVRSEPIRINVHGVRSRYNTLCLSLPDAKLPPINRLAPKILGRTVFVNWPMMHEARVTAVVDGQREFRVDASEPSTLEVAKRDKVPFVVRRLEQKEKNEWFGLVQLMRKQYKVGRGVVGSGGLEVGHVEMTIKVRPLQGLVKDRATGAYKKVFAEVEADVPLQLAMWSVPATDPRFMEKTGLLLQERLPLSTEVQFDEGPYKGCVGIVVGHDPVLMSGKAPGLPRLQVPMIPNQGRLNGNARQNKSSWATHRDGEVRNRQLTGNRTIFDKIMSGFRSTWTQLVPRSARRARGPPDATNHLPNMFARFGQTLLKRL